MDPAQQDDLTADDHLVEQTAKDAPEGDDFPELLQDPRYVPSSAVDEFGDPR